MSLGQFLLASQTCKLSIFVLQVMVYWLVFVTYSSILPNYYLTLDNVFKGSNTVNLPSSYWCILVEENLGVLSKCTPVHHGNSNPDPQSFDLQYLS